MEAGKVNVSLMMFLRDQPAGTEQRLASASKWAGLISSTNEEMLAWEGNSIANISLWNTALLRSKVNTFNTKWKVHIEMIRRIMYTPGQSATSTKICNMRVFLPTTTGKVTKIQSYHLKVHMKCGDSQLLSSESPRRVRCLWHRCCDTRFAKTL